MSLSRTDQPPPASSDARERRWHGLQCSHDLFANFIIMIHHHLNLTLIPSQPSHLKPHTQHTHSSTPAARCSTCPYLRDPRGRPPPRVYKRAARLGRGLSQIVVAPQHPLSSCSPSSVASGHIPLFCMHSSIATLPHPYPFPTPHHHSGLRHSNILLAPRPAYPTGGCGQNRC